MKVIHDRSRRCTVKMKFCLFTFIMVMAFNLVGCTKKQADNDTMNQVTQTSPAKETKQPEKTQKKSKKEELNEVNIKNMVRLKGKLKIEKDAVNDVDKKLPVYSIIPIVIDETVIKALDEKGWDSHRFIANKAGGYVITAENKEVSEKTTLNKEESLAQAKKFLEDSGIKKILKEYNTKYQMEVSDDGGVCIVYAYLVDENGDKTDAYIRMIFEKEKSCECVLNLYQSKLIENLPTIPFEEATKNAFCEDDSETMEQADYRIREASIHYVKGIPYYRFMAYSIGTRAVVDGFALAVDITKSQYFETILEQYKDFSIE